MLMKRKDSGFTLIELMIVIAVIGILAIVLIPKIGTIKTQAKTVGLDTNIRLVQGYAESKIDKWVSQSTSVSDVATNISASFTSSDDTKNLINPFSSQSHSAVSGSALPTSGDNSVYIMTVSSDDATVVTTGANAIANVTNVNLAGSILAIISTTGGAETGPISGVHLYAYDQSGKVIDEKTVHVTP
ncbi:MAG: type II secretion system protein [Eubacteriales bacterium]